MLFETKLPWQSNVAHPPLHSEEPVYPSIAIMHCPNLSSHVRIWVTFFQPGCSVAAWPVMVINMVVNAKNAMRIILYPKEIHSYKYFKRSLESRKVKPFFLRLAKLSAGPAHLKQPGGHLQEYL